MAENLDLETVIEDSVTDSLFTDPVDEPTPARELEPDPEAQSDEKVAPEGKEGAPEATQEDVKALAEAEAAKKAGVVDDFAKRIGIQPELSPGRENRIPYSRVKKIVEKAEKDAVAKHQEVIAKEYQPKLAEFETKVKDYEGKLANVTAFEQIMFNDPNQFLPMLEKIPAYKEFFAFVRNAYSSSMGIPSGGAPGQATQVDPDAMPQPDANGSYSMEQLTKLLDWKAKQVEKQITSRYEPIEKQWQAQQRINQVMPEIQKAIAEARTWPQFTENEVEIEAALKADPNLNLDGAYRKVVLPKIMSNNEAIQAATRKATLEEVRRTGTSTSMGTRQAKPSTQTTGPRDLTDIINEAIKPLL